MLQEKTIGNYTIYSDGRVRNNRLRRWVNDNIPNHAGYIRSGHKFLHKLVAEAFIPNPDNLPEVNHKDGNKLNNAVENLEWCTREKNIQHAFEKGLIKMGKGEAAGNVKLKEHEVLEIRRLYAEGRTQQSLAEQFNISRGTIGKITTRKIWTHI